MKHSPTSKTIPFNGPIDLAKWYAEHRVPKGTTIEYKGKPVVVTGTYYNCRDDENLNTLQKMHMAGELDLYQPIEQCSQKWHHDNKTQTWYPLPGTTRNDLPPIYMQWKHSYARKLENERRKYARNT